MGLKPYRATSHWKKLRLQVLKRDAYTCAYCGDVANEVDHRVAKVKGGEDSLDNCVINRLLIHPQTCIDVGADNVAREYLVAVAQECPQPRPV